ncbi:MAG TPA: hypothetical protein VFW41_12725 [Gaiellaceae bacterium]|nr:hypothetical protein [Gaiellaceae bacterium]
MIELPPPYRGQGPHALWHVSEDAAIERFEPHHRPGHSLDEPLVWAVDERHEKADIELATDEDLPALWRLVIASTLDFSGIRLRNASMAR